MYYSGWIILVSLSLWVSLMAFFWAFWTGQFSEQGRARYLPLRGEVPLLPEKRGSKLTIDAYALIFIAALGVLGLLASMILSLYRMRG